MNRHLKVLQYNALQQLPYLTTFRRFLALAPKVFLTWPVWSTAPVGFRVEAPVARRSPHTSGREDFPHPAPRFKPFLPSRQPIKRHTDGRIILPTCKCSNIMDYSQTRQGKALKNPSEPLIAYVSTPAVSPEPIPPTPCNCPVPQSIGKILEVCCIVIHAAFLEDYTDFPCTNSTTSA
jgi:hypothetical protein